MTAGVGLVGYGLGGRAFHAPYIRATPGMELRAVVTGQRDRLRTDHPDVAAADTIASLLERRDIDLVVISSPDALHAEHAMAALSSGRHVVVDKPFATRVEDAIAIEHLANGKGLVATAFHNRRWDADFLTLRRILKDGLLGPVVQFESHFDRWRPQPAENWKEARNGGSWMDLGPHLVDQAIELFGMPLGVTADIATMRAGAPAPDYFHVTLRYPGMRAILHSSKLTADNGLRFAVHGQLGSWIKHGLDPQESAAVAGMRPGETADWGHDPKPGMLTVPGAFSGSRAVPNEKGDYLTFWRQVQAAIAGEGDNPVPPKDAVAVMRILEAGMKSASTRCEIEIASS